MAVRRGSYTAVAVKNAPLVRRIREVKADHPFWGYRRTWAHLKYVDGINLSKTRAYRLMKVHNLLVTKNMKLKAIDLSDLSPENSSILM